MGGALALDAAWLFAAFLIIAILAAAGIAARRFLLERGGGTVECGLRKGNGPWRLGLASYQREELYWFGVFGVSMRPDETFPRRDLSLVARRLPSTAEAASLGPGMIVVECQLGVTASASAASATDSASAGSATDSASAASDDASGGVGRRNDAGGRDDVSGRVELALAESALTGLLSWLEAAPPGSHLDMAL